LLDTKGSGGNSDGGGGKYGNIKIEGGGKTCICQGGKCTDMCNGTTTGKPKGK
jgi:hypothetical protein